MLRVKLKVPCKFNHSFKESIKASSNFRTPSRENFSAKWLERKVENSCKERKGTRVKKEKKSVSVQEVRAYSVKRKKNRVNRSQGPAVRRLGLTHLSGCL